MFLQNDDVHSFCKHYFPATGKTSLLWIPVFPRVVQYVLYDVNAGLHY